MTRWPWCGGVALAVDLLDDVGGPQDAAVGDRRVGDRHLHRRDRDALADREVAHRGAGVLGEREHDAALLAREVGAGRLAEAEAPHPLVELLGAEPQADRDRADVGGLLEDLARGQRDRAARVRLADHAVIEPDRRRQVELRARRDLVLLERARDRERLERRAGLVGGGDRAVLARVVGRVAGVVGVDPRPVGEREQRAAARVHDDRGGAARAPGLADLGEHLLGLVLDRLVERQRDVLARLLPARLAQLDRLAERVLGQAALAVAAVELAVERVLEAGEAAALGADAADQLRGEEVARVGAARLGDELEALDLHALDAAGADRRHLVGEVGEAGVAAGELAQQRVLVDAERLGDLAARPAADP